jgi:hypothetical protein
MSAKGKNKVENDDVSIIKMADRVTPAITVSYAIE